MRPHWGSETVNCIFVRRLALPGCVRGVAVAAPDEDFVVFINDCLCPNAQKEAAEHEIRHIQADHFYNCDPVVINEREARGLT